MDESKLYLGRLRNAMNTMDGAYAQKTKQLDEKPNLMLVLYVLTERQMSQKQISDTYLIPLSTVNTVVREMEERGFVELEPIKGRRRECLLKLTEAGRRYAARLMKPFQQAECVAMKETVELYGTQFVDALEKFVQVLRREFEADA